MFPTAIAGSLPKPSWLAETHKLNEWYFRLERLLTHLHDCETPGLAIEGPATTRPAELAELAAGLQAYAASGA